MNPNPDSEQSTPSPARNKPLYADILRGVLLGLMAGLIYNFAILGPYRYAQQTSQRTSCQSNLKQIALAYKQYITDWDELYPPLYSDNDRSGRFDSAHDIGWAQAIQPYAKNVKALQCPGEANPANHTGGTQSGYTDYFMNGRLAGISESKFTYISNTVLLGDHSSCNPSCSVSGTAELDASAKVRHLNGANYAFADGHVKWFKPGALTDAAVTATNHSFQSK